MSKTTQDKGCHNCNFHCMNHKSCDVDGICKQGEKWQEIPDPLSVFKIADKAPIESEENICPTCDGYGSYADHNPADSHHNGECSGGCPIQVECYNCKGTGKIEPQKQEEVMLHKFRKFFNERYNGKKVSVEGYNLEILYRDVMDFLNQGNDQQPATPVSAEEILKYYRSKLRILNNWSIIFGEYKGMENKVWYDCKIQNATICPFSSTGGIDQYVFHEILHICQAELSTGSVKEKKEKWEIFIQDLCRIKDDYANQFRPISVPTEERLKNHFNDAETYQMFIDNLSDMLSHLSFEGMRKMIEAKKTSASMVLRFEEYGKLPAKEGYYLSLSKIGNVTLDEVKPMTPGKENNQ